MMQGHTPHFGTPLLHTRTSAFLVPGIGERSLVTIEARSEFLFFQASKREGVDGVDVRVRIDVPGVGVKEIPVKDHLLLSKAEQEAGAEPIHLARCLRHAVVQMSDRVAVRLGLSRGYHGGRGQERCWLMADGFFPLDDSPTHGAA
jgi:hypothetical protein